MPAFTFEKIMPPAGADVDRQPDRPGRASRSVHPFSRPPLGAAAEVRRHIRKVQRLKQKYRKQV